jgi:hypothetical protein
MAQANIVKLTLVNMNFHSMPGITGSGGGALRYTYQHKWQKVENTRVTNSMSLLHVTSDSDAEAGAPCILSKVRIYVSMQANARKGNPRQRWALVL